MSATVPVQVPGDLFREIETRARAAGTSIDEQAAALLADALKAAAAEEKLMELNRREREELAARGLWVTEEFVNQAKRWGRE